MSNFKKAMKNATKKGKGKKGGKKGGDFKKAAERFTKGKPNPFAKGKPNPFDKGGSPFSKGNPFKDDDELEKKGK